MGYDLHITRADEWTESESSPITLDEWRAYVRGDPDLEIAGSEATNPVAAEVSAVGAEGLAVWVLAPDRLCVFDYYEGRIDVKNPDEQVIAKMRRIATRLAARVQGDDGEFYD